MNKTLEIIQSYYPTISLVILTFLLLYLLTVFFRRRPELSRKYSFARGMIYLIIVLLGVILAIVALPVSDSLRNGLLTVVGIILSATITLSSTTFVGNTMAGFMLATMRRFQVGDYIRVEDHFGRISEHSLLHTEIQTLKSDLTTLPNLYLVTHPMTITRASGTIISADISLGYDISRKKVEEVLIQAAKDTELKDPFVRILELGDFSITYSCCGFLEDVKNFISSQTRLKANIIDLMHSNDIEIVSPNFVNLRSLTKDKVFISKEKARSKKKKEESLEEKIFDKAEMAAQSEEIQKKLEESRNAIAALEKEIKETSDENHKQKIKEKILDIENENCELEKLLQRFTEDIHKKDE